MDSEIKSLTRRLKRSAVAFVFVLIIGTSGYRFLVEGTSWFDGLYMTFVTVTTIGFEEVVNLKGNMMGRMFTIFIAISGIGILTYSFTNLAALIIENDFRQTLKKKKMKQAIQNMDGHYIICGASRMGMHITEELEKTQRSFLICDTKENRISELDDHFKFGLAVKGDCTDDEFLKSLGISRCAGFFITTRDDHNNIVICVTARQISNEVRIVTNCKNPDSRKKLEMVGANKVISPYSIGGLRMASEMVRPTVTTFLDEMLRDTNQNLRIEEVEIPEAYVGKSIADLPLEGFDNTLVLAIREGRSWKYNPSADYNIRSRSNLVIMTSPKERQQLQKKIDGQ